MQVLLVMFRDAGNHRPFAVSKPQTVIGRREDCDLRIPVNDVSRKHCRLLMDEVDGLRVEDLGSSNGTFVNGQRVQIQELNAGDTLQVGPVAFVVQIDGVPDLTSVKPQTKHGQKKAVSSIDDELDEMSILNDNSDSGGEIDIDSIK
jgi:pSer/pThr/pTyr-binding forkhead associated (FHA) protein